MTTPPSPSSGSSGPRRHRISMACSYCRFRKIKCEGVSPCANCVKTGRCCDFTAVSEETNRATRERKAASKAAKAARMKQAGEPMKISSVGSISRQLFTHPSTPRRSSSGYQRDSSSFDNHSSTSHSSPELDSPVSEEGRPFPSVLTETPFHTAYLSNMSRPGLAEHRALSSPINLGYIPTESSSAWDSDSLTPPPSTSPTFTGFAIPSMPYSASPYPMASPAMSSYGYSDSEYFPSPAAPYHRGYSSSTSSLASSFGPETPAAYPTDISYYSQHPGSAPLPESPPISPEMHSFASFPSFTSKQPLAPQPYLYLPPSPTYHSNAPLVGLGMSMPSGYAAEMPACNQKEYPALMSPIELRPVEYASGPLTGATTVPVYTSSSWVQ